MDRKKKNYVDIMCDVSDYLNIDLLGSKAVLTGEGPITWGIGENGEVIASGLTSHDVVTRFIEKAATQHITIFIGADTITMTDTVTNKITTRDYVPGEENTVMKAILLTFRDIYLEEKKSFEDKMGTKKDE